MALTDKLTAIADAIREKASITGKLTLDAMPVAIRTISGGGGGGGTAATITITTDATTAIFYYTKTNGTIGEATVSRRGTTSLTLTDALENGMLCAVSSAVSLEAQTINKDDLLSTTKLNDYCHKITNGATYKSARVVA